MNDNELLGLLRNEPQKGLAETVRIYSAYVMKIAYKYNRIIERMNDFYYRKMAFRINFADVMDITDITGIRINGKDYTVRE